MSDSAVLGSCLCGAVRFRVAPPTTAVVHCHCSMCQRNHGAAYVTWVALPRGHFRMEQGGDELVRFESSEHGSRSFCGRCGTSLLCESTQRPDEVDIPLAVLEGPVDREPELHIYYDDRVAWSGSGDTLPRLGGVTGLEPTES